MKFRITAALLTLISLIGCGGNGILINPPSESFETETGVFIDSAVSGLHYSTDSQNGVTNDSGEFEYINGELITFSIGDIVFPEVLALPSLSPLEIFATEDINALPVVNMLRLLQSLDIDGNAENGIEISDVTHQLATGFSIDFSDDNFEDMVLGLITNSEGTYTNLIPAEQAIAHFTQTISIETGSGCTSNHNKVGYTGEFTMFDHDVSGTATIIDDCTIEINQFTYDGRGPAVYFYGAIDHEYGDPSAFELGDILTGTAYDNETVTIKLPEGRTLDDLTGISVWCVRFNADFGNLEFLAP